MAEVKFIQDMDMLDKSKMPSRLPGMVRKLWNLSEDAGKTSECANSGLDRLFRTDPALFIPDRPLTAGRIVLQLKYHGIGDVIMQCLSRPEVTLKSQFVQTLKTLRYDNSVTSSTYFDKTGDRPVSGVISKIVL